jgi:hypothetical protein
MSPSRAWRRPRRGGRVFLIPFVGDDQFLVLSHAVPGRGDIVTVPAACLDRHQGPAAVAGRLARALLGIQTDPQLIAVLPRTASRGSAFVYSVPTTLPRPGSGSRWRSVSVAEGGLTGIDLRPRDIVGYLSDNRRTSAIASLAPGRGRRHRLSVVARVPAGTDPVRAIDGAGTGHG